MNVLVDTSVWSEFLRRRSNKSSNVSIELKNLIDNHQVSMIGPIRQELLSGIKNKSEFEILKDRLHAFPDEIIQTTDYETAAEYFNICRSKGIQGSFIDYLICAISSRHNLSIFTLDKDFNSYSKYLPIILHKSPAS